ncbi:hypothetical protein V6N12_017353 [Hibiscus sabdariffa]|uniref:KAT8 regulatory NSL complex subunit 2 n=1 Tax=Hibiscus sabdariffa TaxID=183260 RepID=A0ABR2CF84_9ROSI
MSSPLSRDVPLARSTHLTREELLKRRLRHLRQLSRCYRGHYWALMENLKIQYRNYYWKFGISPFKQNSIQDLADDAPAMALTRFCHLHILSDSKQKLYKACTYVIKRKEVEVVLARLASLGGSNYLQFWSLRDYVKFSAHAGPITCGKPILRSTVPSLCIIHFQKTQKNVNRALKKANLNVSSSSKLAPMFHVIVAEYVHQIQAKRRAALRGITSKATIKEECPS